MEKKSKNVVRRAGSVAGNTVVMSAGALVVVAGASWMVQAASGIAKNFRKDS